MGICFPGVNLDCLIGLSSITNGSISEEISAKFVIVANLAGHPKPITFLSLLLVD